MEGTEGHTQPGRHRRGDLDRRGFLGVAGAASAAVLSGLPSHPPAALPPAEGAMILQVAQAGAVFPIEFPSFGEPGSASSRATITRLRAAVRRTSAARLALARAGSRLLIEQGLINQPPARLLDGIGRLAAENTGQPALTAATALAIATVSRHFDPDSDEAARVWIDGLRRLQLSSAPAGRGAR